MKKSQNTRKQTQRVTPSRVGVWQMFNRIARRYDLLNRLLSFRQDVRWRNRMAGFLPDGNNLRVLDLATGTADVPVSLNKKSKQISLIVATDKALEMLSLGREKVVKKLASGNVKVFPADAQSLPFRNDAFDAVTISFGIRNMLRLDQALGEMARVLRPGGRVIILEFSLPKNRLFRAIYLFYFRQVLPALGGWLSGDRKAYRYLNQSVETFPYGEAFAKHLRMAGFREIQLKTQTFGIATIYSGEK